MPLRPYSSLVGGAVAERSLALEWDLLGLVLVSFFWVPTFSLAPLRMPLRTLQTARPWVPLAARETARPAVQLAAGRVLQALG